MTTALISSPLISLPKMLRMIMADIKAGIKLIAVRAVFRIYLARTKLSSLTGQAY